MKTIVNWLRRTFKLEGIISIFKWLPIIYHDVPWDYHYFIKILHFKLTLMEKFFRSDKCWNSNHLKEAHNIKIAKLLAERILNRDYLDNALTRHYELYGESKWHFEDSKYHPRCKTLIFDDTLEQRKSFRRGGKHASMMESQDYNMLFKVLSKNIRRWWD